MLLTQQFSKGENSPSQALFSPTTGERLSPRLLEAKMEKQRIPWGQLGFAEIVQRTKAEPTTAARTDRERPRAEKGRAWKDTLKNTVQTISADLHHGGRAVSCA